MGEFASLVLNGGHVADAPADGQVGFLPFPPFDEDDTPKAVGDCVDGREVAQHNPAGEAEDCEDNKEREVRLEESKVVCDLVWSALL